MTGSAATKILRRHSIVLARWSDSKISMSMVRGDLRLTTDTSGIRELRPVGLRTTTDIGRGLTRGDGRGLTTPAGVMRRFITDAGYMSAAAGAGSPVRAKFIPCTLLPLLLLWVELESESVATSRGSHWARAKCTFPRIA